MFSHVIFHVYHSRCVVEEFSAVAEHVAIGAGGPGIDSHAGQMGHSIVNDWPPLRRLFGAALSRC